MKSVLIVSHGSRSPKTKQEIISLIDLMRQRMPHVFFEYAFLEIESPNIPEGIDRCIKHGVDEVVVALNFLNSGRHVNEDIPAIIKEACLKYPHIKIHMTKPIGQHAQIPNLFTDLINETH